MGNEQFVKERASRYAAALRGSEKMNPTDPKLIKQQKSMLETQAGK